MASTLHKCLKYYCGGEKKINGDVKPFTKAESHFTDSKFFEQGTASKKIMPSIISSIGRGELKAADNSKVILKHDSVKQQEYRKGNIEQETITQLAEHIAKQVVDYTNHMALVLRYVPEARHKEGETPLCVRRPKYWGQGYQEG